MFKIKQAAFFFLTSIFCFGSLFISKSFVFAEENGHIIISEIQVGGASANDEFVELYNPANAEIDLSGWDLKRKTKTGNESNILNNIEGAIPAHGHFLIAPRANCGESNSEACYTGNASADDEYTTDSFLAKDNTVLLYDQNGNLVDKAGWGETGDFEGEVISANPENNQSLERKVANSAVQDTDNNKNDFEIQTNPNPQNSGRSENPRQNEPPAAKILSPENNSAYTEGEAVNFKAEVSDLEDGAIGSDNIIWKEGDSELGKGNEIEIKNLAVGSHIIVLEVRDSGGEKTIKEITVKIISAQNVEDGGEESEVGDGQNNSNQGSGTGGGQSGLPSAPYAKSIVPPKIIITEFLPNPEDSDRDSEFVEIYNSDSVEIDLSKWTLEDKIGQIKQFAIAGGIKIKPGKYKVFYSDETRISMNNSGDGVILRDNKGNIASETPICDSASDEQSYALDENSKWVWTLQPTPGRKNIIKAEPPKVSKAEEATKSESESKSKEEKSANDGEEKQENPIFPAGAGKSEKEQYNFSDRIIVSEIYPNPKGRDNRDGGCEWIELYNDSDEDVNLKGWRIDDILEKGSKPYIISGDTAIKAKGYLTFGGADTKLALNNSGDEVNIFWPDGTVVDSVKYGNAAEGLSYNLSTDDIWIWSSKDTRGKENITKTEIADENSAKTDSASEASFYNGDGEELEEDEAEDSGANYIETTADEIKKLPRYTLIKVTGIVSAPPGIFSDKAFYISGSGIQIYSYEAKFPKLNIGDKIEIVGRISEVGGERRILLDKTEDIKIVGRDNPANPKIISTGNIGESNEGYLATVEGKMTQMKNDVFFMDDGSGEIKVYIKPQTGILKPNIKRGDWLAVTGEISQTSAGYRLLPRFQSDIKPSSIPGISTATAAFSDSAGNGEKDKGRDSILAILLGAVGALVLIDWGKMRMKTKNKSFKV